MSSSDNKVKFVLKHVGQTTIDFTLEQFLDVMRTRPEVGMWAEQKAIPLTETQKKKYTALFKRLQQRKEGTVVLPNTLGENEFFSGRSDHDDVIQEFVVSKTNCPMAKIEHEGAQ